MRFESYSKLQLVAFFIILIAGCNSEDLSNNSNPTDTTSSNQSTSYTPFDAFKGVPKISPNLYKQLADTLIVGVVVGTYKPGDSSIMHAHPDFAHLCIGR